MKSAAFFLSAIALASTTALSAGNKDPEGTSQAAAEQAETNATAQEAEATAETKPVAKEEKRICRRINTDMSSRKKQKVCMTKKGWREFNQRR